MPTIIDAFVVELGLDPNKFTQGAKQAYDAAKKLEEQQLASAKNVEHSSERAAAAIGNIKTQALQMLAVFTGSKSILEFSANLTHANAELGRTTRSVEVSARTLSAWQGAVRIFGGDAKAMAQTFTTMSDAFSGWKVGNVSPLIADLRAISTAGGKIIDVNGNVEQSFLDLSENLKNIHDKDPAMAGFLGRKIGLDPSTLDLLLQGPAAVQKVLDYVKQLGVATKEDTDAFGELEKRMAQMGLKAESLGRKVLGGENGFTRQIIEAADFMNMSPGEANAKFWSKESWSWVPGLGGNEPRGNFEKQKLFPGGRGAFTSQAEKEAYIRAAAARRGINPNIAMAVAKSEGFNSFVSTIPGETSYGAFQLNVTPGGRKGHLGDQFRAATGLDPSDRANERATIDFALDDVRKNGWTAFHGAKNTGIGKWAGVDRNAAGSTSTTTVQINGPITVQAPQGADADTFADRFAAAVRQQTYTAQANGGQQ